jgi:hypothetical protein
MASNCQASSTSSGTLSINEGVLECSACKECAQPLPTSKDDHPQLEFLEQEPLISMHGVLKDCEIVGLPEVEPLNVQNLLQIDPLDLKVMSYCQVAMTPIHPWTFLKLHRSQVKRKLTILLSNFPKRITRTKGPAEDVAQFLTN